LLKEIVGIEVEHFDAYSVLLAFRFPLVSFRKDLHPNWIMACMFDSSGIEIIDGRRLLRLVGS